MPKLTGARESTLDGRFRLIVALTALSFTLRLATSAVAPLLPTIRASTGLSAAAAGILLAIPYLTFGILAPFAPRLSRRYGAERSIAFGLSVLIAGILLRSAPGSLVLLFGGTFVIGIAITVGNVLVPSVIKRDFHDRPGPVMGLYTTAVTAGIAVAAAFTVPIMRLSDWGWRPTLAVWAVAPALVLVVWHLLVPASRRSAGTNVSLRRHSLRLLYRDRVAWTVTLFFGLQALIYNAATAWIPTVLVSHGVPHSEAGFLLAIVSVTGMVTTFTVPVLAMRHVTQRRLVVASIALLAGSIVGLLLSPVVGAPAWMLLFGLGQGACYGLGLSFVLLRTSDSGQAADLSGMTQTVGYPLSAVGPISIGILHEISGGWILPLIVLLTLLLPLLWVGLFAAHGSVIFGGGQDEDPEHVAALPRL